MSKQTPAFLTTLLFLGALVTFWWCAKQLPVAGAFPTKPLNERSTELSWQAWLLVDQTRRDQDSGQLRRRITPKSVFIAPTFNPDALPACADGYASDSMGRCIKVIRIDEAAHLDFLLQRLTEQFADYDYDQEMAPQGPLQLTIPLTEDEAKENATAATSTEVAIVLAPTGAAGVKSTMALMDVERTSVGDRFDLNNVASFLRVKPEDVETTTIDLEGSTSPMTTTDVPTSTLEETTTDGATSDVTTVTDATTMVTTEMFAGL